MEINLTSKLFSALLLCGCFLLISSCKKEEEEPINLDPVHLQARLDAGETPKNLYDSEVPLESIYGLTYKDGYIFDLDTKTGEGMVAALEDASSEWLDWGCAGEDLPSVENSEAATGLDNTLAIVYDCASLDTPAHASLVSAWVEDANWFLPSKLELRKMFENLRMNNQGNFQDAPYWSSTEINADMVWAQYFGIDVDGWTDGLEFESGKTLMAVPRYIRPARVF
ncbi:MAG: hypothetical protein ACFB10_19340 [Salibacteraceae bacterium]